MPRCRNDAVHNVTTTCHNAMPLLRVSCLRLPLVTVTVTGGLRAARGCARAARSSARIIGFWIVTDCRVAPYKLRVVA
eukprot:2625438-Alexandrium_andersonii.AAC.1